MDEDTFPFFARCLKVLRFLWRYFGRMAFVVEKDKFFDPVNISLFGVAGVMLDSDGVAHLV